MILEVQEESSALEDRMFFQKEIIGLLKCQKFLIDGRIQYQYDIGGFQSLETILKYGMFQLATLKRILEALIRLQEQLKCFFLNEEHLFFTGETIFLDNNYEVIKFCYIPGKLETSSLIQLIEYLMEQINHRDEELRSYVYELHECLLEENFVLPVWILNHGDSIEEQVHQQPDQPIHRQTKQVIHQQPEAVCREDCEEVEVTSLWMRILARFRKSYRRKEEKEVEEVFFHPMDQCQPAVRETVFFEPEIERSYLLQSKAESEQDIKLGKGIVVIGKNAEFADVVLEHKTISRIHSALHEENGEYFIEDLNSTNGTYVNEQILTLKEQRKLVEGDLIRFGRVEYLFKQSFS